MAFVGIFGKDNNPSHYPLLSSTFDIHVRDRVVDSHLYEIYESRNTDSLIRYVFFLPPEAALLDVQAQVGKRPIKVELKTSQEADRLFKEDKKQQTAVKVQETEVNTSMFQIVLGHVQSGEKIGIRLVYYYLIATDITDDSFRLDVPIGRGLFDPRTPGTRPGGTRTVYIPPSAPAGQDVISIDVHLSMNDSIWNIASPSHNAQTEIHPGFSDQSVNDLPPLKRPRRDDTQAYILFRSKDVTPKNFNLVWEVAGSDKPVCSAEFYSNTPQGQDPTIAFAMNIVSRFEFNDKPPQDFLFLVDCSGSMAGARAETAKTAVRYMIDKIPYMSCTFNIFRFTTTCNSVLPNGRSIPYHDENKRLGKERIPGSESINSGGTDIHKAILTAIKNRDLTAERTSIIIVTDGLDWDSGKATRLISTVAERARNQGKWIRLFVLGIGDEISRGICEALAQAGAGAAAYIGQTELLKGDHVKAKSERLMRSIALAPLEVVKINWPVILAPQENPLVSGGGLDFSKENDGLNDPDLGSRPKGENLPPPQSLQQSPNPGNLFWALQSTWYAICKGTMIPGRTVASVVVNVPIRGPKYRRVMNVPLYSRTPFTGKAIHPLAAHALIRDFEHQILNGKITSDEVDVTQAEISRLGLRYNVISSQTTFVSRPQIATTQPIFLSLPEPTDRKKDTHTGTGAQPDYDSQHGWNKVIHNRMMLEPEQHSTTPGSSSKDGSPIDDTLPADLIDDLEQTAVSHESNSGTKSGGAAGELLRLKGFLRLQNADGSFSSKIATQVFPSSAFPALPPAISVLSGKAAIKESIWVTIIAIVYLEKKYAEDSWKWGQAKTNGLRYILSQLGTAINLHSQRPSNIITRLRVSAELYVD